MVDQIQVRLIHPSPLRRLLNDPKPHVVGIAWVVECVEHRAKVDESKFKVDLEGVNVAGTNKVCFDDIITGI